MAESFEALRNKVADRIWYKKKNDAFAFLVDAPHTFGHSQLVIKIKTKNEEECFSKAVPHIKACIKKLSTLLPSLVLNPEWKPLVKYYTRTKGKYEKTLLLRTSADEAEDTYKIHLVPYFTSHLDATNRLHQATHNTRGKGGLLHWLGQREVILDYDMRHGRRNKLVKDRIESFNLERLASELKNG